jgi:hypothetical protein
MTTPTTITTTNPPTTPRCCLNQPSNCRVESETPHSHAPTTRTGSTSTSYGYNPMGAMTSRGTDTLAYDAAGRLAGYTSPSGTTTFTHSTTNQRLTRSTAGITTLYLPGMEVTSNATTVSVTRYRTLGGVPVATETAAGVYWNCGHHQTSTTCQAPAATSTTPPIPARCRYQPYGTPRGTNPFATVTDHGFLNQPEDPTGHPYLNAHANPTTYTDPTGLCSEGRDGCGIDVDGSGRLQRPRKGNPLSNHLNTPTATCGTVPLRSCGSVDPRSRTVDGVFAAVASGILSPHRTNQDSRARIQSSFTIDLVGLELIDVKEHEQSLAGEFLDAFWPWDVAPIGENYTTMLYYGE